ncbi:hypothetical protein E2C01_016570 [Portunus trituberculatus]|uniref:Uncharacterized protein n=1 Tax=Portunus trituberculatus TaxID=210409 RepID=A0A5B7DPY6_PORTR|nr:hypothetical protein [Portunus trituberculatus]
MYLFVFFTCKLIIFKGRSLQNSY